MLDAATEVELRQAALKRGAHAWRDPNSPVRQKARAALCDGDWPSQTVERALDQVLLDFEKALPTASHPRSPMEAAFTAPAFTAPTDFTAFTAPTDFRARAARAGPALAVLAQNVIGLAVSCAYCAGIAGKKLILKSAHSERLLAAIVADQFDELGPPLQGSLRAAYWKGGDADQESGLFAVVDRVVVFGRDETIASVQARAPSGVAVVAYGDACSVAYVRGGTDLHGAASAAALDVAMFDQRGCMSPQTVYVEGDEGKAMLFGRCLASALGKLEPDLPRATPQPAERIALADAVRRLQVTALPAAKHAPPSLHLGPDKSGVPEFVVAVEPYGPPTCVGFGRVVIVKPCAGLNALAAAASALGSKLETIGIAGRLMQLPELSAARRICALGEMQSPPFGYRPTIADFASRSAL